MRFKFAGAVPGLLLLLAIRGVLLWIMIPLGIVAWGVTMPWQLKQEISLGQFLGWADNNLTVILERSALRPLFPVQTHPWISARNISNVKHRIGKLDLF